MNRRPRALGRLPAVPSVSLPGLLGLLGLVASLATGPVRAQVPLLPQEVERVDVIAIERDGRELFGFDALTGRRSRLRLELGEEVLFQQARGRIGLVLTDRRALAVAPGTDFQELRFQLGETAPALGLLEDRVALVVTGRRALGFVGAGGMWIEENLPPNESLAALRVGATVGVVTTNRRALGLSADRSTFVEEKLGIHETVETVSARDSIVTLRTDRRILVFSAAQALWSEQDRRLR
ncbi:MAG: hypothetical protein ACX98W_06520 [bacterium]